MRSIALGLMLLVASSAVAGDSPGDHFEKKVRPVLVEHCEKCHGAAKQSSDLRLDSREAVLKGGSMEGPAVVPGDPGASPLVKAVRHAGDLKMPKAKLADAIADDLAAWVKAGAPWPAATVAAASKPAETHWSYKAVRKVDPPKVSGGPSTAIDAFLVAALDARKIVPGPRADRRTLLRRATFDLTGLPPTQEEIDLFLADSRPDREAFAEVVDRLLASPHYGERWGRLWLDVARYADTKGYVFNEEKNYPFSYTYRDWVVEAFNDDLPYDQFVLQQVAGDRLPIGDDNRHLAAMGFLTVGRRFLKDDNEIIDDRIDVVTRGLLGLSVACARCHDHKFDPIPTDDYYSLYGVFNSSEEPADLPLIGPTGPAADKASADYKKKAAERKKAVDDFALARRDDLLKELRDRLPAYLLAAESIDFEPRSPKVDEVARAAKLRPELVRRVAARWKQRAGADDPVLRPWKALAALPADTFKEKAPAALAPFRDPKAPKSPIVEALAAAPIASRKEAIERYGVVLARALAEPKEASLEPLRAWLASADGPIAIKPEEVKRLCNRAEREKLQALEKKVAALEVSHPGAPARAMVMVDRPKPIEPRVFIRGNSGRQGKEVPRRFLKVISGPDRAPWKEGSGRLELARSIATKENPLTARVMVNRIWQNHFGRGIVGTPSDFGARGDAPTHPELLDWLAATFVEGGWSVKAVHRLILASDAYARSSLATPAMLGADPQNLLLARQARRRLDFETMRDALLAASGRLDPAIGGKPVPLEVAPFPTRRALYGYIDRYNLDPVFRTFDFPNPDTSSPKRSNTIVPQQALYLLNSPFVAEQARHLATRSEPGGGTPEDRARRLTRIALGREATAREAEFAARFVSRRSGPDASGPISPWRYGIGEVSGDGPAARLVGFEPFPHWTGKAWQRGPKLPSPEWSYASLTAGGGHPGLGPKRATVIRWVAPADLTVSLAGTLGHPQKDGDGVRLRVVSARLGLLGTWAAHEGRADAALAKIDVKRGETLDLAVDSVTGDNSDSYAYVPSLRVVGPAPPGVRSTWDHASDFSGPEPPPLSAWEAYAQALLLTNEFLYLD